jgi:hypothetical protein
MYERIGEKKYLQSSNGWSGKYTNIQSYPLKILHVRIRIPGKIFPRVCVATIDLY